MATAAAPSSQENIATAATATDDDREFDHITQTLAPSHILADGRFVYLPPPSAQERVLFFERAIAKHGLLQEDLTDKKQEEKEKEEDKKPKVHPLALASARLQANGINELNRAINLATLVSTGEYFGMSNIVDPSLEISVAEKASVEKKESAAASGTPTAGSSAQAPKGGSTDASTAALEVQEEQRVKALYVLKRKRSQFQKASEVFRRHRRRLASAVVAQARPDQRLRELRKQWHLVAPEHGTRALPHAPRPTEVVACDVDVYWKGGTVLGRLARRVPRYATVELKEGYKVHDDLRAWERKLLGKESHEMEIDNAEEKGGKDTQRGCCTKTEPFAIADPTLGKLDADFDPTKVVMLSLQFDIEKPSTGFCQSACLEPMTTATTAAQGEQFEDESVLVSLQHSLFCAKLFESIRREIAPDTEEVGQIRILSAATQNSVWLSSCASEENYLPAVARMSGDRHCGLAPMCVIHCHEGEVKVQLDCEYTLRVRLVESDKQATTTTAKTAASESDNPVLTSGSQTPSQLLFLCRALLLHAQETYHQHSIQADAKLRKAELEKKVEKPGHMRVQKAEQEQSPRILQSCVTLGTKMLLEERIRKCLVRINEWLHQQQENSAMSSLTVLWLPLSIFDLSAQFNLSFQDAWSIDVNLFNDEITVTQVTDQGVYSKVKFHSHTEFELYLMTTLRRVLKQRRI